MRLTNEIKFKIEDIGVMVSRVITEDLGATHTGHSVHIPFDQDAIVALFYGYFFGEELPGAEIVVYESTAPKWVNKMWPPKKKTYISAFRILYPNFKPASVPYKIDARAICLEDWEEDE